MEVTANARGVVWGVLGWKPEKTGSVENGRQYGHGGERKYSQDELKKYF